MEATKGCIFLPKLYKRPRNCKMYENLRKALLKKCFIPCEKML